MSLQDICMNNIADSIRKCPPLIQELIIGKSADIIKEDIKKELTKELTKQIRKQETDEIKDYIKTQLKYMVPVVVSDIMASAQQGRPRTNFRSRWWDEDLDVVNTAIEIANVTIENIGFHVQTQYYIEMDSDSDYESDS